MIKGGIYITAGCDELFTEIIAMARKAALRKADVDARVRKIALSILLCAHGFQPARSQTCGQQPMGACIHWQEGEIDVEKYRIFFGAPTEQTENFCVIVTLRANFDNPKCGRWHLCAFFSVFGMNIQHMTSSFKISGWGNCHKFGKSQDCPFGGL